MKNKSLFIFTLIAASVFFSSCEKTVMLDLERTEPHIIIEGLVTDTPELNFVKVTRSTGFYNQGQTPRITNAVVSVADDDGNAFVFNHYEGDDPDSIGFYLPPSGFAGAIGKTYTLSVTADGTTFTATDDLRPLVDIDKLDYRVNENEQSDPEEPGRFYEALLWVKEPKETRDYYLFKSYRNGVLEYQNETDIYFADDELIGENIDGLPLPVFYALGDNARIEVYSLTRAAFVYYRDLQKLLTNDGGLFGTPPANPRGNINGGALGLFQVSAVKSGEVDIE